MTSEATEDLKSPKEWETFYGVQVLDPDGWRSNIPGYEARSYEDLIDAAEFTKRFTYSTVKLTTNTTII